MFACALIAATLATTNAADARWRRHHHQSASDSGWHYGHASIVVDAKTGKVLQESNADKLRHPASLTKIMTLYLLFERIHAGRLRLDSKITISAHAADQAPTKLDLNPGEKIEVEDAIKAVVTRSANDIAVAIGETIGGSEDAFAAMMTRKAHALGMKSTVFTNASGLPDKNQVTTARDLALLGRAIQDRFPRLYRFFSIRNFIWRGSKIANHNHLLGHDGVDGIKTGYTRASGFNLVTSVKLRNRYIVAVVLGGRTSRARDARMRELIDDYIPRAYAGARTAPMLAEAPPAKPAVKFAAKISHPPLPRPSPVPRPSPGSREPIRPMPVRTVQLNKNSEKQLAEIPASGTLGTLTISPFGDVSAGPAQSLQVSAFNATPNRSAPAEFAAAEQKHRAAAEPEEKEIARNETKPAPAMQRVAVASMGSLSLSPPRREEPAPPVSHDGWQVQIGAYAGEQEAHSRLQDARSRLGSVLAKATSFTEKTVKGSVQYVRARFAGFHNEADARKACQALRKNDFACITVKN